MDRTYRRQFSTQDEALAYLENRGKLQYFGRAGHQYEYYVYTLTLHDGRVHRLLVRDDGLVVVL